MGGIIEFPITAPRYRDARLHRDFLSDVSDYGPAVAMQVPRLDTVDDIDRHSIVVGRFAPQRFAMALNVEPGLLLLTSPDAMSKHGHIVLLAHTRDQPLFEL